jgi:hypothetical protein
MTRETITIRYDYDAWAFPWWATFASYDGPESPIGTGATPEDALTALLEMVDLPDPPTELDPDRLREDRDERQRLAKEYPDAD